jgi:hypothetical protein
MAEDEAPLKSFGEVIPSLYYDLIARVCAGVPFILLLVNQQAEKLKPLTSAVGASGTVLLMVLFGYLLGLLLTPLGGSLAGPIQLLLKKRVGLERFKWMDYLLEISRRSDAIAVKDRAMGAAIGKMGAERILCQNLLLGSVIVVIVDMRNGVYQLDSAVLEGLIVALLGILVIQRNVAFLLRQSQLYALLFGTEDHTAGPDAPGPQVRPSPLHGEEHEGEKNASHSAER